MESSNSEPDRRFTTSHAKCRSSFPTSPKWRHQQTPTLQPQPGHMRCPNCRTPLPTSSLGGSLMFPPNNLTLTLPDSQVPLAGPLALKLHWKDDYLTPTWGLGSKPARMARRGWKRQRGIEPGGRVGRARREVIVWQADGFNWSPPRCMLLWSAALQKCHQAPARL